VRGEGVAKEWEEVLGKNLKEYRLCMGEEKKKKKKWRAGGLRGENSGQLDSGGVNRLSFFSVKTINVTRRKGSLSARAQGRRVFWRE